MTRAPQQHRFLQSGLIASLQQAGRVLLDLLYPPHCAGCGRLGSLLCPQCESRILIPPAGGCWRCGHQTSARELCPTCRETPSALDGIIATTVFAPPIREAIHRFKYDGERALARPLGERMAACWREAGLPVDLFVPVPLHPRRLAERGYNQSALLADVLSKRLGIPVSEALLIRHKATRPQVGLDRLERQLNVSGAFVCKADVAGKRAAVVDDVCTTGATLEACAAALRAAGAASVWGLTLARPHWEPGTAVSGVEIVPGARSD